jgi:hypothetical protein
MADEREVLTANAAFYRAFEIKRPGSDECCLVERHWQSLYPSWTQSFARLGRDSLLLGEDL